MLRPEISKALLSRVVCCLSTWCTSLFPLLNENGLIRVETGRALYLKEDEEWSERDPSVCIYRLIWLSISSFIRSLTAAGRKRHAHTLPRQAVGAQATSVSLDKWWWRNLSSSSLRSQRSQWLDEATSSATDWRWRQTTMGILDRLTKQSRS